MLCWVVFMPKSQGHTVEKATIDLGTSGAIACLALVCLSQAKQVADLLIEPTPQQALSMKRRT